MSTYSNFNRIYIFIEDNRFKFYKNLFSQSDNDCSNSLLETKEYKESEQGKIRKKPKQINHKFNE